MIYNPLGAGGAAIFPFTVTPTPIANGTCRVTNIVSYSYTFLFLKPSDNRVFVLLCSCNQLCNHVFLPCPDSLSLFTCFLSGGGMPRGIWFRDPAPSLSSNLCFPCLALLQRAWRRKLGCSTLRKHGIKRNH